MKKRVILLGTICAFFAVGGNISAQSCADSANIFTFYSGGKAYDIIKEMKTWSAAAACALERGGHLVHIDNQAEQALIYTMLTSTSAGISPTYTSSADGGGIAYAWIGATDKHTEGTWKWDGDNNNAGTTFWTGQGSAGTGGGTAVAGAYNNWGGKSVGPVKEPDDYAGNQDAAAIALANWPAGGSSYLGVAGEWNDISLTNLMYYIVERSITSSVSTVPTATNVKIYPNPAKDFLNIELIKPTKGELSLRILNQAGQTQITQILAGSERLDISSLPQGLYLFELRSGDYVERHHFVK